MTQLLVDLTQLFDQPEKRRQLAEFLFSPDQADDVVQDLYVSLLGKPRSVQNSRAYLKTAARNRALNIRRSVLVRDEYENRYALEDDHHQHDIERTLETEQALQALKLALLKLPAVTRAIFVHYYVNGHTQAEIAAIMNLHQSTIEKQLASARGHCQARLANYM